LAGFAPGLISYNFLPDTPPVAVELSARIRPPYRDIRTLVASTEGPVGSTAVDPARAAPLAHIEVVRPTAAVEVGTEAMVECTLSLAEEPWIGGFNEFSAPPVKKDAFPGLAAAGHAPLPDSGFLGRAVGSVHEPTLVKFWKETFERDIYVENILRHGYKIPVKISVKEATKTYREKNNKSARDVMPFVRFEVKRLVKSGQVIQVDSAPRCTNPLSAAFKINSNGSIKKRLVIDLSRWVNKFIAPDRLKMARFQDALSPSSTGGFPVGIRHFKSVPSSLSSSGLL
jgi:hypothetical protein